MDLLRPLKSVPGQGNELVASQRLIAPSGTARVFKFDAPVKRSRCGFEALRIPGQAGRGNRGVGIPDLDGFQDRTGGQVPACSQARRNQDRRGRIDRKCCELRSFLHHRSPEKRAGSSLGRKGHSAQPAREKWLTIAVKVLLSGTSGVSQAALLVDLVKRTLRHKGLTYRYVAKGLKLSESSVKRMFARRNLSLGRLERICALMNLEIADLLDLTRAADGSLTELSEKQERELVGNLKLLLVGMLALSHWTAAKILETYRFSEAELVGLLTRLDRMRIIDLLPENRIKLRVTVHGSLSEKSNGLLQQRMRKLAEEFDMLAEQDKRLAHEMREGTSLVMAIRPWELAMFGELRRSKGQKGAGPIRTERRKSDGE